MLLNVMKSKLVPVFFKRHVARRFYGLIIGSIESYAEVGFHLVQGLMRNMLHNSYFENYTSIIYTFIIILY